MMEGKIIKWEVTTITEETTKCKWVVVADDEEEARWIVDSQNANPIYNCELTEENINHDSELVYVKKLTG
tara:strand:- start:1211 stop:1420 length:210 start_codon:yes stop_codon:yes gene_type:complete